MANIYKKTMRDALKEARDYREPEEAEISERTAKKGEITITKGRKVQIIKAKNWPTYQAKGWSQSEEVEETEEGYSTSTRDAIKRAYLAGPTKTGKDVAKALKKVGKGAELYIQTTNPKTGRISNSGVVLSVKGDDVTISPTARNLPNKVKAKDISHMDVHKARTEEVELTEGRVIIAVDKKTKKKWQFSGGMTVKFNGKDYNTEGVTTQQVLELSSPYGKISIKLGKKDIEDGFASGIFHVVNDGSVYQPWKNDFEPEGEQELDEGKDYRLLAQRHTMNLSKQAIVALVADLYKKLDKLGEL